MDTLEKVLQELDNCQSGKDDFSKPILSRVPPEIILAIEKVREYGCQKYPEDSWKAVDPQRYWEAALRHVLAAWNNYKAVDQESGLPHIWHVACNLAFIMAMDDETKVPDWLGKACEVLGEIE